MTFFIPLIILFITMYVVAALVTLYVYVDELYGTVDVVIYFFLWPKFALVGLLRYCGVKV